MPDALRYGPAVLAEIARLCEEDPQREACGFVVRRGGGLEVVPIPNAADALHLEDPVAFPRTSRDSYVMEPRAQLRVFRDLEASGAEIVAVWHSHVDAGAHFSEKDRADAVIEGVPVLPGVEYLVFGLRGGRVVERRGYRRMGQEWVGTDVE